MTFEEMEARLRARLEALPAAARAELLHVLLCPTSIAPSGSVSSGAIRSAAPSELLMIDCDKDRTLRAVLVGMLREGERSGSS